MFGIKGTKILVLLGSILLALAVTGGLFAFTYTTRSQTITVTAASADFGTVTTNSSPTAYTLVGRARGAVGAATLFNVSTDANYTGDVEVQVSLANPDELTEDYSFWMIRLELTDSSTTTKVDEENITQVLSLDSPFVSFAVDSSNLSSSVYVHCVGGAYRAWPFALGSQGNDPLIFCEVVQADAH